MSKYITPTILAIIAIAVFVMYTKPTYSVIAESKAEEARINELLSRTRDLQELRDDLLEQFNAMDMSNVDRLMKFLPDNVDNIKLLIELDGIATRHGMVIRDVGFNSGESEEGQLAAQQRDIGSITVNFAVSSTYERFVDFFADLEQSLRLVDVESVSFTLEEGAGEIAEYSVSLKTYWLPADAI